MTLVVAAEPGSCDGRLRAHAFVDGQQNRTLRGQATIGVAVLADMPWESIHNHGRCLRCDRDAHS